MSYLSQWTIHVVVLKTETITVTIVLSLVSLNVNESKYMSSTALQISRTVPFVLSVLVPQCNSVSSQSVSAHRSLLDSLSNVTWQILTRLEASSATASLLPSSSPSSHSVRARTPAGTCCQSSNSRHRSPTPESRATGGHTDTPATSEDRRDHVFIKKNKKKIRRFEHLIRIGRRTQGKTYNMLERLYISSGLGMPWIPREGLEYVAGQRDIWTTLRPSPG